jgi:hypothetical protein
VIVTTGRGALVIGTALAVGLSGALAENETRELLLTKTDASEEPTALGDTDTWALADADNSSVALPDTTTNAVDVAVPVLENDSTVVRLGLTELMLDIVKLMDGLTGHESDADTDTDTDTDADTDTKSDTEDDPDTGTGHDATALSEADSVTDSDPDGDSDAEDPREGVPEIVGD